MEKKFLWLGDFFQTVSSTTSSLRLVYYCLYGFIIIISNPFGCERERELAGAAHPDRANCIRHSIVQREEPR